MTPQETSALRTARALLDLGHPVETILMNSLIPVELREFVRLQLEREQNFTLSPARAIVADRTRRDWLREIDRSAWHYWPALRQYLISAKGWESPAIRSLDDSSDRVLRQLAPPTESEFDVRGLVLGFVQSGKTANFTAVIAKAADAGYRLVVVLSGIDNGLRRQTQVRLTRELVGYADGRGGAVRLPPLGLQWHEFTRGELDGDFQPGFANHAALQGSQPVLLVVKKNGPVLRRLLRWLDEAPVEVRHSLPMLVVDDEADQASVDTRGTYQAEDDPPFPDYEPPSVINGLIRQLLGRFQRTSYVAYTATPFANILIPHDAADPEVQRDLYPKDFIIDLPKPPGYFGAEEFFGRIDPATGEMVGGIDLVRGVPDADIQGLDQGNLPQSLELAITDFVLAGAARAARGDGDQPATMLIHTSARIAAQRDLRTKVADVFGALRDEWRYQRGHGIRQRLDKRWEAEFRRIIRARHLAKDVGFDSIEPHIGPFVEAVQVREVNSETGEVLDYEREPTLKAIAVGGNRLSRGLTLEGLLVSYFVRRSVTYDTLMQMGRWFGFRDGYEDLTRIYTTSELAGWFSDLALVEHRLRSDIEIYEARELTPLQMGSRIWQHPVMQVTSALKRRFATSTTISQSYSLQIEQTFKFPLRRLDDLVVLAEKNRLALGEFVKSLGEPGAASDRQGPVWLGVPADLVLRFLAEYQVDEQSRSLSLPLIRAYIERLVPQGELVRWVVAIRGREKADATLGRLDLGLKRGPIFQISRSRISETDSLGVITSPGDELIGLSTEQLERVRARAPGTSENSAGRQCRAAEEGLVLLYPISRASGYDLADDGGNRRPIYGNPADPRVRDLIGMAISFPESRQRGQLEAYIEGTVGWRPVE